MIFRPIPLTLNLTEEAIALVQEIFPYESKDDIRLAIRSSVDAKLAQQRTEKWDCPWNCYWVIQNDQLEIIGVTGLYELGEDRQVADWVAWFAIRPDARGQGLGKLLLQYTIEQVQNRQKKYLRLYTSSHPNEARANLLYEKNGFRITRSEQVPGSVYSTLYREKVLGSNSVAMVR